MKTETRCMRIALVVLLLPTVTFASARQFDEFGYNYNARIFIGRADGVDRKLDGKVWGPPNTQMTIW